LVGERLKLDSIIVTGGAGFIGSNFVLQWLATRPGRLANVDSLTYAGNTHNLESVSASPRYAFLKADINDRAAFRSLLETERPWAIVHFAAESHVDRSIVAPDDFIRTNVNGTFALLEEARRYFAALAPADRDRFRFVHVSTDEVYGSLGPNDPAFAETNRYMPNSPYSASKAASDHLVRAYFHTYGLPTIITNCSNNYGPYQFPEKLIPLMVLNAWHWKPLPVYGDGLNVRDWLYVEDHCTAVAQVLEKGRPGEIYNVGGRSEKTNLEVVHTVCDIVDELLPSPGRSRMDLITFVKDRPGHDRRYAIDCSKIERELGWRPIETFASGLRKTVQWYLDHEKWLTEVASGEYRKWMQLQYAAR
jgi:dTDP-glucose 4,6-dehydratase